MPTSTPCFGKRASAAKVNLGEVLARTPCTLERWSEVLSSEPTGLVVIAKFRHRSVQGHTLRRRIRSHRWVKARTLRVCNELVSDRPGPGCNCSQRQLSCRTSSSTGPVSRSTSWRRRRHAPWHQSSSSLCWGRWRIKSPQDALAGIKSSRSKVELKSSGNAVGSGSLQFVPTGTRVSVRETATKMISISDNTAADMLINLVGQPALESQVRQWSHDPQLDSPFLTTRQMILLHYVELSHAGECISGAGTKRTWRRF